jgi:hypothetical protein
MLFAQIMTWKSSVSDELRAEWIKKRAEWKPPEGVNVIAEYLIPAAGNKIVVIYQGDDLKSLMGMRAPWMKYYDIDVHPCVAMDELVSAAPKLLEALE